MQTISEAKQLYWNSLLNEMDMKHSSKKTWDLKLNGDPTKSHHTKTINENQVVHKLLLNGKINQDN